MTDELNLLTNPKFIAALQRDDFREVAQIFIEDFVELFGGSEGSILDAETIETRSDA